MRSRRPGAAGAAPSAAAASRTSRSSATAQPRATTRFSRLCAPTSGLSRRTCPDGVAISAWMPSGPDVEDRTSTSAATPAGSARGAHRTQAPDARDASVAPKGSATLTTEARGCSSVNSRAFASPYAAIVPWKSRWSCVRFVNAATRKRTASTRSSASPWLDTSITRWVARARTASRATRARSSASGVVWLAGATVDPTRVITVVESAGRQPRRASIASTRNAVVVLPFVPVMPTTSSAAVGSP